MQKKVTALCTELSIFTILVSISSNMIGLVSNKVRAVDKCCPTLVTC